MTETIAVRNDRDRNYNGVMPHQVTKIPADQLDEYLEAGFTKVESLPEDVQDNGVSNDPSKQSNDIQARIKFLKDHGINVGANRKEATIITRSDEAGYGQNGDIQKRIQFLKDKNIEVEADRTDDVIVEKSDEAGYEEDE